MSQDADYIVFQPAAPAVGGTGALREADGAPGKLTEGIWQQETLSVLEMYSDSARFSPVGE